MRIQSKQEELLNTVSHALGALLGIVGFVVLLSQSTIKPWSLFSIWVYGVSLIVLFTASALYHAVSDTKRKHYFRIIDHISIYLLIAGTSTPVLLLLMQQGNGWLLFWVMWGIAAVGAFLKLFFTGRFEKVSTLLYVVMGWLIVLDYKGLTSVMPSDGLFLLFLGGLFYTGGIVFYVLEKMKYNHVIWHFFVLAGAISHYFMILNFVV